MNHKKLNIFAGLFTCLSTIMLIGCSTIPAKAKMVSYQCERGTNLSVTFIEKGFTTVRGGRNSMPRYEVRNIAADILLADGTLIYLPVKRVESGFMYSNGRHTFSGKNNEAMWSVGKMVVERCAPTF